MHWIKSFANPEVLRFYQEMPFNYGVTSEIEARDFVRQNIFATSYAFLHPWLEDCANKYNKYSCIYDSRGGVLDVGCGTGLFTITAAWHYQCPATGIDFNEKVIARAKENARVLGLNCNFMVQDLFTYHPENKFEVVSSQGVLHHTDNCREAVRAVLRNCLKDGGIACIGLYHKYGRKPFLEHFSALRAQGWTEEEMFAEYRRMNPKMHDDVRLKSWFRDQVLHPHETQHTLGEFVGLLEEEHCKLVSTSINRFAPFENLDSVLALEPGFEAIGRERLSKGGYYTGYFVFIAQKTIS